MDQIPVEVRLKLLAGEVYSAAEIGMWCFGEQKELFYSTCPYEKELLGILRLSNCLDFACERKGGCDKPTILNDSLNMIWVAEHVYKDGKPGMLQIMGPVFQNSTSVKSIESSLHKMNFSVSLHRQIMRILDKVPLVMTSMLNQYCIMMHYMITGEKISPGEFIYQNEFLIEEKEEASGILENVDTDRMVQGEKMLLKAIRDGNMNYMQVLEEEADFGGTLLFQTGNSIRDSKDTLIVFCALCTRAAMEGGISPKTAKEMEVRYMAEIEECTALVDLRSLNTRLMKECVERVHQNKINSSVSISVRECCDYIKTNVLKPLSIENLAERAGYTEYYFTKKFHKEMGIRLVDYIKQERIEYAKIALITTKQEIQEISDLLHFGTRNYFTTVFRESVGMTPAAYRARMQEMENDIK